MSGREPITPSSDASSIAATTEEMLEGKIEQSNQTNEEEIKAYLGDALIPLLAYGLDELEKARPKDPVLFLSHFLLRHNPKKGHI